MNSSSPALLTLLAGLALAAAPAVSTTTLSRTSSTTSVATPQDASPEISGTSTVAGLRAAIDQAVEGTGGPDARWSIQAVSVDREETLYSRNASEPMAPASNLKLFTSAAALEHLGADYRFSTFMVADGPIRDGVLMGNLYLYGTGDPTLGTRFAPTPASALVGLADSLEALGVREIRGDIIGDGSYFSGPRTGAGWESSYMNAWYAAPAGALSVHENIVRVQVSVGEGGELEFELTPGGEGIAMRRDTTGNGRLRVRRADYDGPIVVIGRSGESRSHAVTVADTEMYAAALFRDVLVERGIALGGETRGIIEPTESPITGGDAFPAALEGGRLQVLAVHRSEPLHELLRIINHRSHNFYSEQLLRALGRVATGEGSADAGAAAVEALLERTGVETARIRVVDGCGLSPLNRASAESFVSLLAYMARSAHGEVLMESLPVAGEVRRFRRMGGTAAGGNLRAKTGTIDGVSALSGYVTAANGELIAFSIIGNGLRSESTGKLLENQIGTALANLDR